MAASYSPLQAAHIWTDAGVSVIPIRTDGSKAPTIKWEEFQTRIMTHEEIDRYFKGNVGIGIIGGAVSGNLEIIDVEGIAPMMELSALWSEHLSKELIPSIPQVLTPSGGRHLFYRCAITEGNQKLAQREKPSNAPKDYKTTLIETRGEGGYVLAPMSPPSCHELNKTYTLTVGRLSKIPKITEEQREILLSCCRSFNRLAKHDSAPEPPASRSNGQLSPGDDYNSRGDALGVLLKAGWKLQGKQNGQAYLCRPGKKSGVSASFGVVAPNKLYVFSSNALPFENEHAYDAFGIVTRLEYGGNFQEAARQLRKQGYGEPPPRPIPPPDAYIPKPPPVEPEKDMSVVYQTMNVTEHNVALVFEDLSKDKLRYCDAWGKWLEWQGSHWNPDSTLLAFHYARTIAARLNREGNKSPAKASFARGVEFLSRTSRHFATIPDQWDRNPWLLNTPGGTFDLETGETWPHRQTDHITRCTRVAPADGDAKQFAVFMQEITLGDGALEQYLQIALGACLSGAIKEHWLMFWIGSGRNGKNTLGDLIMWMLGSYASTIPTSTLMSQKHVSHPTDVASLRGLRLACASEVPEGSYWDEAKLQELTGDAVLKARFMRQDTFTFSRTHKFLIYGRHRPLLRVVDAGMRGRLHMVPFKASFLGREDLFMPQKLRAEAPQIMQWLIDGHKLWLECGQLKKCSAVEKETDDYFSQQSTPDLWVQECCLVDSLASCQAGVLYENFKRWKTSRGEGVPNQTRWGEWMSQRYDKSRSRGVVIYRGIDVKPQSVLEFQA